MPTISEKLSLINNDIKKLSQEAKEASSNVKGINEALKFDSTNIDLVKQRFTNLEKELDATNRKIEKLKASQKDLEKELSAQHTEAEYKKINAELDKIRNNLAYAEQYQKGLESATSQTAKNQALVKAATEQVNKKYETLEKQAKKVQVVTLAIVYALSRVATQSAETGSELYALSKRYQTSAEDIQNYNNALLLATGQQDLFTQSLSVMVKGLAQIAAGRGVAFKKALSNIGIAYKDISQLSAGEQFEKILNGLAGVENYSTRAAAAQQLLGDSGQYIASIFEQDSQTIEDYLQQASQFAIISNENAQRLAELQFALKSANSQLEVSKAEIAIALVPAFQVLAQILTTLQPIIKNIAKGFEATGKVGATLSLVLVGLLFLFPIITSVIKLFTKQNILASQTTMAVGNEFLKTAVKANILKLSLIGIMGVAGIVLGILGAITTEAATAKSGLDDVVTEMQDVLGGNVGEYTANTERYSTTSKTTEIIIDANIHAEGDTPISDDGAVKTAHLMVDEMQKAWGELTK